MNEVVDTNKGLQGLYQKILSYCQHRWATRILGVVSFTESCCFIIPPEFMMLPMSYANRERAWYYAFITTITSVLGAIAGYYLGHFFWSELGPIFFAYINGFEHYFNEVGRQFEENDVAALLLAAFTPIPFKVFTVASGVYADKVALFTVIWTAILGRGVRYFSMAGIVYFFGERAQVLIERHFKLFTVFVMILGIALIAFLKLR
jgi:membrane protein YqaA with SNARE-associated domain